MREKQKVLNILSIIIIVWQAISAFLKVGLCSVILLSCIITCSSDEVALSIVDHINCNTVYTPQMNDTVFGINNIDGIVGHYTTGNFNINDIRTIAGTIGVIIAIVVIEILIVKIYFIVCGILGLRCSKDPEKGKSAFVAGCVGIVVSFIQAFLTYLGDLFICFVFLFTASAMNLDTSNFSLRFSNTVPFPIVFIVYTILIGLVRHQYKDNTKIFKNIDN